MNLKSFKRSHLFQDCAGTIKFFYNITKNKDEHFSRGEKSVVKSKNKLIINNNEKLLEINIYFRSIFAKYRVGQKVSTGFKGFCLIQYII